jgi:hypothetical protein
MGSYYHFIPNYNVQKKKVKLIEIIIIYLNVNMVFRIGLWKYNYNIFNFNKMFLIISYYFTSYQSIHLYFKCSIKYTKIYLLNQQTFHLVKVLKGSGQVKALIIK